jgi:hypothetical protein
MYLEPWSAHKNCNTKYSIKSTGQNLLKAIEGKYLNISVLKAGLPNLADTLDASFRNWQRTSGTRFEVAVRLKLKHFSNPAQTLFDIGDGLNTAWAHLESSFTFSDIHSVVMHSSLCTAATLLGYRASLDALNDAASGTLIELDGAAKRAHKGMRASSNREVQIPIYYIIRHAY